MLELCVVETQGFVEIELTYSPVWGLLPPSQTYNSACKNNSEIIYYSDFILSILSLHVPDHQPAWQARTF